MFETLDTVLAIGVVFLIFSMVHKYLMSIVKRVFKIKAKVIASEMRTFIGENTTELLIPYLENRAKHLNFLENIKNGEKGLRLLNKEALLEVIDNLDGFLEDENNAALVETFGLKVRRKELKDKINEITIHLKTLKSRIENMYDNTIQKITEIYKKKLRYFTLISGLILAFIINADFFEIYNSISQDIVVREKIIAKAEALDIHWAEINSEKIPDKELEEEINRVEMLINDVTTAGIHLGWSDYKPKESGDSTIKLVLEIVMKIIGIGLSGLLISFGAPFWHDFLSSFTGIKNKLIGPNKK